VDKKPAQDLFAHGFSGPTNNTEQKKDFSFCTFLLISRGGWKIPRFAVVLGDIFSQDLSGNLRPSVGPLFYNAVHLHTRLIPIKCQFGSSGNPLIRSSSCENMSPWW
jgi:hypothetical protein